MNNSLTYRLESFPVFWQDSAELREEHEAEQTHDPRMVKGEDEGAYFAAWLSGMLQIVVARSAEGQMAGYFLTAIRPHSHYSGTLAAYEDAYFLSKAYRKGRNGVRLIQEAEAFAQQAGAKVFYLSVPIGKERQSRLLTHMGFKADYMTHVKWIAQETEIAA